MKKLLSKLSFTGLMGLLLMGFSHIAMAEEGSSPLIQGILLG